MAHAHTGEPHQLVIVGGGVAGIELASMLARRRRTQREDWGARVAVTLVDHDSAHVWKPMLHTIAAGTADVSQQQTLYLAQAHAAGFFFEPGELRGIDRAAHAIELAALKSVDGRIEVPARRLHYDTLVMAVGSEANDFGTPGVAAHCREIDSRPQADAFNRELRLRMLQSLSLNQPLSIAIVGGGATGVELAAELVRLMDAAASYGVRGLSERISITLLEAGSRLLPAFPTDISAATKARLESLGIRVLLDARVAAAEADAFTLADGQRVPATLKVWAAGVKGPDFLARFGDLEVTRGHQLVVQPSLQTTRDASIYAIGDCASLKLPDDQRPLAPTAQVAHQQAQHLIRHLPAAILWGRPVPDFAYRDFGALVSLGDYDAFASLGKFGLLREQTFHGWLVQWSHVLLYRSHQARVHGFWRGSLLWWIDWLNARVRPSIRLNG